MKKTPIYLISLTAILAILLLSSCKSNQEVVKTPIQSYQFLITIVKGIDVGKVLSKYDQYQISDIKQISKSQNMHTFKVGLEQQQIEKFLSEIKENARVVSIAESRTSPNSPTQSTNVQSGKTKAVKQ